LVICQLLFCISTLHLLSVLTAGFPAWNAITDDAKLLLGDEAAYAALVQKYGKKAVEDRQKFLVEAECGNCATNTSR